MAEIESRWMARRREQLGVNPVVRRRGWPAKAAPPPTEREKGRAPGFVCKKAWASPQEGKKLCSRLISMDGAS